MIRPAGAEWIQEAAPILSSEPGTFAWGVLHNRHPALLKQVRDGLPYPPEIVRALNDLAQDIAGPITPLDRHTHDYENWNTWTREYLGQSWFNVPFLWAESYFYRKLMDAVGYFESGPWRGIDPFEPFKMAELDDPALSADIAALDDLASMPAADQSATLLSASLWGNRADLGFRVSACAATVNADHVPELVVDQSALIWALLEDCQSSTVCIVADNAARELLADLILIDHLLEAGYVGQVALHMKPHPYYVSDATTADVIACVRRLCNSPGRASEIGHRLWHAIGHGKLIIRSHSFYCAPLSYHHMPPDLAREFADSAVTIMKGDLNYRRLVGDSSWPATSSFDTLTAYFPNSVAVLRTLKSDVIVGVSDQMLARLDATTEPWRTTGTHGVIQVRK